ncbi:recombinase family protein [Candidatus Nomurabacteria bacterium]|nr:recombinase family protein [Candidatus Nomurabacteria bacterium]
MANGKYISYIRVSTLRQGASGLGLEAQQKAIKDYLNGGSWELLEEFVEIESGKKNDRPKLAVALQLCSMTGATLIIAKLDRLARNVAFISRLMDSGVDFVAVDFPQANRLTVHILAAVAEHEGKMISERVRLALTAAKARGTKLGSPKSNLTAESKALGSKKGNIAKAEQADMFALKVKPRIEQYVSEGQNLSQIANSLNDTNILTARGKTGAWTPQAVKNAIIRYKGVNI